MGWTIDTGLKAFADPVKTEAAKGGWSGAHCNPLLLDVMAGRVCARVYKWSANWPTAGLFFAAGFGAVSPPIPTPCSLRLVGRFWRCLWHILCWVKLQSRWELLQQARLPPGPGKTPRHRRHVLPPALLLRTGASNAAEPRWWNLPWQPPWYVPRPEMKHRSKLLVYDRTCYLQPHTRSNKSLSSLRISCLQNIQAQSQLGQCQKKPFSPCQQDQGQGMSWLHLLQNESRLQIQ